MTTGEVLRYWIFQWNIIADGYGEWHPISNYEMDKLLPRSYETACDEDRFLTLSEANKLIEQWAAQWSDYHIYGICEVEPEDGMEGHWIVSSYPKVMYLHEQALWSPPKFKVGDVVIPTSLSDRDGFKRDGMTVGMIEFRSHEGYIYWQIEETRHETIRGSGFPEQYLELFDKEAV